MVLNCLDWDEKETRSLVSIVVLGYTVILQQVFVLPLVQNKI